MKEKDLNKLLCEMGGGDVKVPKNLAAKIMKSMDARAAKIERRHLIWSRVKFGVSLLFVVYALSAIVLHLASSNLFTYLAVLFDAPGVFFSGDGMLALYERLPVLAALVLILAGAYAIRHVAVKGVQKRPAMFATAMTGMAVLVISGAFFTGMAAGMNSEDGGLTAFASSPIFSPVVKSPGQQNYSTLGEVIEIGENDKGARTIKVLMENGEERIVLATQTDSKGEKPAIGDKIIVVGGPVKNVFPAPAPQPDLPLEEPAVEGEIPPATADEDFSTRDQEEIVIPPAPMDVPEMKADYFKIL